MTQKRSLPIVQSGLVSLGDIRIAAPCDNDWNDMRGDEKIRRCDDCNLNVHNFTAMNHDEISEVLNQSKGRVCGALYLRHDGTFLTEECPLGIKERALLQTQKVGLKAALLFMAVFAFFAALGAMFGGPGADCTLDNLPQTTPASNFETKVKKVLSEVEEKLKPQPMMLGDIAFEPTPTPDVEPKIHLYVE